MKRVEIRRPNRSLRRASVSLRVAVGIIVLAWFPYTLYFALDPGGIFGAGLGFLPGVLDIGALLAAGLRLEDCYLRVVSASKGGPAVLAAVFLLLIAILPAGRWVGWSTLGVLLYAPLSGISQELYFRSSLLPAVLKTFEGRMLPALVAHSALFAFWHLRMLPQMPLSIVFFFFREVERSRRTNGPSTPDKIHDRSRVRDFPLPEQQGLASPLVGQRVGDLARSP